MASFNRSELPPENLEDRLRGLILKNSSQSTTVPPKASDANSGNSQFSSQIPPMSAKGRGEHQAGLPTRQTAETPQRLASPAVKQKRPNQAQRRQMNSHIVIPIDPRPAHPAQSGRHVGYGRPSNSPRNEPTHYNPRTPNHQQFSPRYQTSQQPYPKPSSTRAPNFNQSYESTPLSIQRQSHPGQASRFLDSQHDIRPPPQNRQLFQPGGSDRARGYQDHQEIGAQISYLENLVHEWVPRVGIEFAEATEKENFRAMIETICQDTIAEYERSIGNATFLAKSVELQCFGSMRSGFATRASDMDLALLAPSCVPDPHSPESRIPRLLEKKLLSLGYGARLLTRTRVPIIKLCEKPTEKLLTDLRDERLKWDTGVADEAEDNDIGMDAVPSDHIQPSSLPASQKCAAATSACSEAGESLDQASLISPVTRGQAITSPAAPKTDGDAYQAKLSGLRQQDQQSIQDYSNSTKRLLRRLGGRDITPNSPDLSEKEGKILVDVCKVFVLGLGSEELSTRLQKYPSVKHLFTDGVGNKPRSLNSIWTQAEGERLAMGFAKRTYIEYQDRLELEAAATVESWFELQNKSGSDLDSIFFGRQLHATLEKMKKITSLQLLFLEQYPFEEPTAYFARTEKMQHALRSRVSQVSPQLPAEIAAFVAEKYVHGINNTSIREAIAPGRLEDVHHQHVALQLALDYEHALGLSFFDDNDIPDVKVYVNILRSQSEVSTIDSALIDKIRGLPDPTQVSTLKPRDPYKDKLEFPRTDIGIQCDINFSAQLAIHNTLLLRCYAASDVRVQPMILFVKTWAKVRGINIPYRGTLSSYGYVLMVLHYLTNIAQPFVCPNLQLINKDPPDYLTPADKEARTICEGRDVRFWRNEVEIRNLAEREMLNHNKDLLGLLLRGFFEYYAQNGQMSTIRERGFDWGREVLSLRTRGGILSKQEKGWTGAKTVVETSTIAAPPTLNKKDGNDLKTSTKTIEETKEIRYRYLFAIEDPFELDHNVARTVTHNGIVSIRDEFRRAWRIIKNVGKDAKEGLLDPLPNDERKNGLEEVMEIIHGSGHGRACRVT